MSSTTVQAPVPSGGTPPVQPPHRVSGGLLDPKQLLALHSRTRCASSTPG